MNWHLLGYLGFISPTLAPELVEACLLAGKASRASLESLKLEMSGMKLPAVLVFVEDGLSGLVQPVVGGLDGFTGMA